MKKTTQLKQILQSSQLEFLMEAHNGISAKIVEEAGFKGIWGSGLSISGSLGVRDNNEASWTQILEVIEFMSDATSIPILLDGDTGYGNFNNMRRLVKKLEQRDIAGVCIEDKIFPKTNSFLRGEAQPLADIEEFCGKIKAGKDTQKDSDFIIAARVEAFIAGWGLKEALKRAYAYAEAGADAILVHSKLQNASEIFTFMNEWNSNTPVIIVPTKYYSTPTQEFEKRNISIAIWANHLFRGAVQKMQEVANQIYQEENLLAIEDSIIPVKEIFRLQNDQELANAEEVYLSQKNQEQKTALILAASRGEQLGKLTKDIPKTMIKIGKQSILETMMEHLQYHNIKKIGVVCGYKKDTIQLSNIQLYENEEYETTGQLFSLSKGIQHCQQETIILFGDILFKKYILQLALDTTADLVLIVDKKIDTSKEYYGDFVIAQKNPKKDDFFEKNILVEQIVSSKPKSEYYGEWIGMMKCSTYGIQKIKEFIEQNKNLPEFRTMDIRDMLNALIKTGININIQSISGHWVDVNYIEDITTASKF